MDLVLHCVKNVQIRTKYGDLLFKSPYSVRIRENTEQKKLRHFSRSVIVFGVIFEQVFAHRLDSRL